MGTRRSPSRRSAIAPRSRRGPTTERADSKDVLFLAVYEHGVAWVRADQAALADPGRLDGLAVGRTGGPGCARQVAAIFFRHAAFLRPGSCSSPPHLNSGAAALYDGRELGDLVTLVGPMHARDDIDHPDPETVVRDAFNTVFATLVMRIAYGPACVTPADDDEAFLANLSTMTRRWTSSACNDGHGP